jgi:transcriptional regulator with XRE-family HTH domain
VKQIYERVRDVRLKVGLSQVEFSKRIFFSKGFYGDFETGKKKVTDRIIQLVSSQFNVNKEWLKTGEGEMFMSSLSDVQYIMLKEIYDELDDSLRKCLVEQSSILLKLQREKNDKKDDV